MTPDLLARWLTIVGFCLVLLWATVKGFSAGNIVFPVGVALLPVVIVLFLNHLTVWFYTIAGLYNSWLYLPALSGSLPLFTLASFGIVPVLVANRLFCHSGRHLPRWLTASAIGYLVMVLVTIAVRGFGLRAMGGQTWGGSAYVELIVAILLFVCSVQLQLRPDQWRKVLLLYFASILLPIMAELIFLLSGGAASWVYRFIQAEAYSALSSLEALQTGQGILRFQVAKNISLLFLFVLVAFPYKGHARRWIQLVWLAVFVLSAFSGHRTEIVYLLLLIPALSYVFTRRVPVRLICGYGIVLTVFFVALHFAGDRLPLSIQRAFSWVPSAKVSIMAERSAESSTIWRFEVWKRLMDYIPDYWLIGRGFAFHAPDYFYLRFTRDAYVEWAVITHNYHSGPLSLLIDLGAGGFLFGSLILVGGTLRHLRQTRFKWPNAMLERCHHVLLASFCVDVFRFYVIHGDAGSSFVHLLLELTFLEGMVRARGGPEASDDSATESVTDAGTGEPA